MLKSKVLANVGFFLLCACSPGEVDVAYYCEPSGATIFQEDTGATQCPMTLKYNSYDARVRDGKFYTDKINVVWPSGASVLYPPMAVDIPPDQKVALTFTRPSDFPYAERDRIHSTSFDENMHATTIKYVVSPRQDRDLFATLNRNASCFFSGLFWSVDGSCPN